MISRQLPPAVLLVDQFVSFHPQFALLVAVSRRYIFDIESLVAAFCPDIRQSPAAFHARRRRLDKTRWRSRCLRQYLFAGEGFTSRDCATSRGDTRHAIFPEFLTRGQDTVDTSFCRVPVRARNHHTIQQLCDELVCSSSTAPSSPSPEPSTPECLPMGRKHAYATKADLERLVARMQKTGITCSEAMREVKKQYIVSALKKAKGNRTRAAHLLGIHVNTLARNIRTLGIHIHPKETNLPT
jgi:Bacterial regulatory protein, Fis family